jgi:hypothetical protein
MNGEQVTKAGQLKKGDKIKIIAKSQKDNYESITVKKVIETDYGEEIILNLKRNYYYVTRMMLAGESWAVKVIKLNCVEKKETDKVGV